MNAAYTETIRHVTGMTGMATCQPDGTMDVPAVEVEPIGQVGHGVWQTLGFDELLHLHSHLSQGELTTGGYQTSH